MSSQVEPAKKNGKDSCYIEVGDWQNEKTILHVI
jgi:hypothetical protein